MKLFYFILLSLSLTFSSIEAQENQPYGSLSNTQSVRDEFDIALKNGFQNAYAFSNRYKGVKGHPFMYQDWVTGIICLKADSVIISKPSVKFRFDSYNNELWIMNNTNSLILYSPDINWFSLNGPERQHNFYKFAEIDESEPHRFYELIVKGQHTALLKEVKKVLIKSDFVDKGMFSRGDPDDRFEEKHNYLFSFQGNEFHKLNLNVKALMKLYPQSMQSKLKEYCKINKLSGKINEIQAIELISYIDSIIDL